MKRSRIGMRVSDEVRALILTYGDLSEAATALLLIGAAAMDADLSDVRADLVLLEQQQLAPAVKQQIRALLNKTFNEMFNSAPSFSEERTVLNANEPTNADVDLLADIGIEV